MSNNLTAQQFDAFKEKYANLIVNNMTLKECQELIFNQICNDFDSMSFDEIVEHSISEDKELIDRFVELQVDSMDHESLEQFVTETLRREFDPLSNSELQDEIRYSFDDETLDELVNNVCNEDRLTNVQQ